MITLSKVVKDTATMKLLKPQFLHLNSSSSSSVKRHNSKSAEVFIVISAQCLSHQKIVIESTTKCHAHITSSLLYAIFIWCRHSSSKNLWPYACYYCCIPSSPVLLHIYCPHPLSCYILFRGVTHVVIVACNYPCQHTWIVCGSVNSELWTSNYIHK